MIPLISERLILRDFTWEDFQAVHSYASDPEVVRYMLWGPNTVEDTNSFLKRRIAEQDVSPRVNYEIAITLKKGGTPIGGCGLNRRKADSKEASVGYCLHRDHWGNGIATEVAVILIEFGFKELNLHRITATCDPDNLASRRVLEKNDMRLEGHFREYVFIRGEWRDRLYYAILKQEWSK